MNSIKRSLRLQFFLIFVASFATIIALLAAAVVWSMHDGFSRYLLHEELGLFSGVAEALGQTYDPDAPNWPHLTQDPEAWRAFIAEHYSHPAVAEDETQFDGLPPIEAKLFLLDASGAEIIAPALRGGIFELLPICLEGQPDITIGWLGLYSAADMRVDLTSGFLSGQYRNLLFVAIAALGLSVVISFLIGRHMVKPINAVAAGTRRIAEGDFTMRLPHHRQDELGQLIEDTNTMAANLEKARAAEKQWISDTSHELQTPLAVLRAQIEAIQDGIDRADGQTLAQMHDAVMRLTQLVDDIKTLSFTDEGQMLATGTATPLDLPDLLRDRLRFARMRLEAAGLEAGLDVTEGAIVFGSAKRLAQVFDNIIENACHYTQPPGRLEMTLWTGDGSVFVRFDDTPPAPQGGVSDRLFDRFYRAETSRCRSLGGSGLGLAICKAIVVAHNGSITASASPLGGLRIELRLPLWSADHDHA